MFAFSTLTAYALLALSSKLASASPVVQSCLNLVPGQYSITSVAFTNEMLGVGSPNGVGNIIVLEKAPPQGQLGVWQLAQADQGGYHMMNVELARNVSTLHLVESNLFLGEVASTGTSATTYAIECAGILSDGVPQYVIKNITADQLWTTIAGTGLGDQQEGVATVSVFDIEGGPLTDNMAKIQLLPASGNDTQHFLFQQV